MNCSPRASGLLLPVFSLPGPYGIGALGAEARHFVDFLADSGQRFWQVLPLGPVEADNSPYLSPSSFAGNPLLIDLEELAQEGLLTPAELASARLDAALDRVDYPAVRAVREVLLRRAWERAGAEGDAPLDPPQLEDYVRFAAGDGSPPAYHRFLQRRFFRQWFALKDYANARGVEIIGDLPFYVSPRGAEVRACPQLFQLDGDGAPVRVSGVPPDAFSPVGQHWGGPLYDWANAAEGLFDWWRARLDWALRLYDAVRIDHFRGVHTYWSIPADADDARAGRWEPGPGAAFVDRLLRPLPPGSVIAEDLGDLGPEALAFVRGSGLPGMNVLLYAFGPGDSAYLPHNAAPCSVMYTGTHDTPTFLQWLFEEASPQARADCMDYLRLSEGEGFGWGAVRGAWASPCRLAVAPFQDVLGLGADARLNAPGTVGPRNWSWRARREAMNPTVAERLLRLTRTYRRSPL